MNLTEQILAAYPVATLYLFLNLGMYLMSTKKFKKSIKPKVRKKNFSSSDLKVNDRYQKWIRTLLITAYKRLYLKSSPLYSMYMSMATIKYK